MILKRYQIEAERRAGIRCYRTPIGVLPSVTTILGNTAPTAAAREWRAAPALATVRQSAADAILRGRAFHSEMEAYFLQGRPGTSPYFESVRDFLGRIDAVSLVEGTLWHGEGYAGTVDCVAVVEGRLCVIDWKTTSRKKTEQYMADDRLQVAAYRAALQALYGVEIAAGFLVYALPDSQAQVIPISDCDSLYGKFLYRLRRYRSIVPAIAMLQDADERDGL